MDQDYHLLNTIISTQYVLCPFYPLTVSQFGTGKYSMNPAIIHQKITHTFLDFLTTRHFKTILVCANSKPFRFYFYEGWYFPFYLEIHLYVYNSLDVLGHKEIVKTKFWNKCSSVWHHLHCWRVEAEIVRSHFVFKG